MYKRQVYDPTKPLIVVWDFNVAPYMSTLLVQIDYDKKKVYIIEEILGKAEDKEKDVYKRQLIMRCTRLTA